MRQNADWTRDDRRDGIYGMGPGHEHNGVFWGKRGAGVFSRFDRWGAIDLDAPRGIAVRPVRPRSGFAEHPEHLAFDTHSLVLERAHPDADGADVAGFNL